jgi:hypothetical protein
MGLAFPLALITVDAICLFIWIHLVRRRYQRQLDTSLATYELTFPRDLEEKTAARLFAALSGLVGPVRKVGRFTGRDTIVFEVYATQERVHYLISFRPNLAKTVESHLTGVIRGIGIEQSSIDVKRDWTHVLELARHSNDGDEPRLADPKMVEVLLRSTRHLAGNEAVLVQFVMTPIGNIVGDKDGAFWAVGRLAASSPCLADCRSDEEETKDHQRGHDIRARQHISRMLSAYRSLQVFAARRLHFWETHYVAERHAPVPSVERWSWYRPDELAVMCGLPIGSPEVPGVELGRRKLAPDPAYPRKGIVLGEATYPGARRPIAALPHGEVAHQHIMGLIGRGKSVQIVGQLLQLAEQGYGAALIDPTGDTIGILLDRWPKERVNDVILLDLTNSTMPVGFNVLAGNPAFVTNQVMAVFDRVYGNMQGMAQTNTLLRATVLTLAHKGYTLLDIPAVLAPTPRGRSLRAKLTRGLAIPALTEFWADYEALPDRQKQVQIAPVVNRLAPFATWDSLRGSLGQAKSGFSFDEAIATSKVILVNLNKSEIGEEENQLYGSLFFAQFWAAAQRRSRVPQEKRKPYFLYIDEFQNYVRLPMSFATVLDEARKFGLSLSVAHHRLDQLPRDLHEALMGNAMNKLIFDVNVSDRAALARALPPTTPDDFILRKYEAVARLVVDNDPLPPVTIKAAPPRPPAIIGRDLDGEPVTIAGRVREASQARYGKPMTVVEAEILARRAVAGARPEPSPSPPVDDQPEPPIGRVFDDDSEDDSDE